MLRVLKRVLLIIAVLLVAAVVFVWLEWRASLPQLDGEYVAAGLSETVSIQRDDHGVVTIQTPDRAAAAFATGFVHAQDRFFQMDLARRFAAGELAELFGERALGFDRTQRRHQMRRRSQQAAAALTGQYRRILESYVAGVNAGWQSLDAEPFEYSLLRADPHPWELEDSALVLASMYFRLQARDARDEQRLGWLADCLPRPAFDFLAPLGTEWDAPLTGGALPVAPIPSAQQLNIRELPPLSQTTARSSANSSEQPGSNNWALSGGRTANGAALVANDMHLGMSVPHIWYRLRLQTTALDGSALDLAGLSLPGMPFVVVGSNTRIAWGFTNSYGDWLDLIRIMPDPDDPDRYLTPAGSQAFRIESETIRVNGGEAVTLDVRHTRWGPIINEPDASSELDQPLFAWRWLAHMPAFFAPPALLPMEHAGNVFEAIELAPRVSIPAQNLVVGDHLGNIGWTIMGQIPLRQDPAAARLPLDWRNADESWPGWLPAADYPAIINPPSGQLWTANNRQTGGEELDKLGYGQVALGARAAQIRDGLSALQQPAQEQDMHAIQFDHRGLYLQRWRDLLLDTLDTAGQEVSPMHAEIRRYVSDDPLLASPEAVGYRLVRAFRQRVINQLMQSLSRQCPAAPWDFNGTRQAEGPVWQLLQAQPMHLLDAAYPGWQAFLQAQVEALAADIGSLPDYTWGAANRLRMEHPLASGIPLLGRWLNMPVTPMAGDNEMPRVQRPGFGQSQRMAVSPGHEAQGYMVIPGGQSGHPLSPFYRSLHQDWVDGAPTPFLPGETRHTLVLKPAGAAQ